MDMEGFAEPALAGWFKQLWSLDEGWYSGIAMTHTAHRYIVSRPEILGGEPVIEGTRHPGARRGRTVAWRFARGGDYARSATSHPRAGL